VASSSQLGQGPELATDGNSGTAWISADIPVWLYVDFGQVARVDRAVLNWREGDYATRYSLYAWMGSHWRAVYATSSGDGGLDNVTFSPVQTRFLLLYGTAGPSLVLGLNEFEVYGSVSSGTYPDAGAPVAEPEEAMWSTDPANAPDGSAAFPDVASDTDAKLDGADLSLEGAAGDPDAALLPNPESDSR
jgi:hypothetical protein